MIVAGFGFRKSASVASLQDAFERACVAVEPDYLAAPEDKATAEAFRLFAAQIGVPIKPIPPDVLARQNTLTQSQMTLEQRGIGSVAEAAALGGAGQGARLMTERHISADRLATCALAKKETS